MSFCLCVCMTHVLLPVKPQVQGQSKINAEIIEQYQQHIYRAHVYTYVCVL